VKTDLIRRKAPFKLQNVPERTGQKNHLIIYISDEYTAIVEVTASKDSFP